jgi:hypothetical protein
VFAFSLCAGYAVGAIALPNIPKILTAPLIISSITVVGYETTGDFC